MPGPDLSLVPTENSPNNQVATFSQQGSVDWAALGRMQFSASIAVLGRLSGAGIEPLTIAVGQALCSHVPLGAHGEMILMEAMNKLKAFSTFGDVVWFGVGVRHILRELVQTSQGASCVALCAALTEGHSISTSALIMYEMTKVLGSPQELSPSFLQWEALVKVCSSVFASTNFGIRVQQYLKLVGYIDEATYFKGIYPPNGVGHPRQFARAMLAIGKVVMGVFQYIEIVGGPVCCWLVAYAENILGLRVQLQSKSEDILFMNHPADTTPQVLFKCFDGSPPLGSLECILQSYYVSDGRDFVRQFFRGIRNVSQVEAAQAVDALFLEGRVQWPTLFRGTFGQDLDKLFNPIQRSNWLSPATARFGTPLRVQREALNLLYYAANYVMTFPEAYIYGDSMGFLQAALALLPELQVFEELLLEKARMPQDPNADHVSNYRNAKRALSTACGCARRNIYCIKQISELIIILTLMVGRLELESPLLPCRAGIRKLYSDLDSRGSVDDINNLAAQFTGKGLSTDLHPRLAAYVTLFSGTSMIPRGNTTVSAVSDGKIYCYVNTMRHLSDRLEQASRVHVGVGGIYTNSRHYDFTCDKISPGFPKQWRINTERKLLDIAELFQDTTSPTLRVQAAVEEGARLTFWYQIENEENHVVISPVDLITRLARALPHRCQHLRKEVKAPIKSWTESPSTLFVGEGMAWMRPKIRFAVRPHKGNLLGRIIALYSSNQASFSEAFLIDHEDDLVQFAEYLSSRADSEQRNEPGTWFFRFALIS